ncbi:hypothetical protein [Clostridium felsineum]|nr:hypothetical protein [Clostridium felsineum]
MPYLFFGNATNLTIYFAELKLRIKRESTKISDEKYKTLSNIKIGKARF